MTALQEKIRHEFQLQGLSKPRSFTCKSLYTDDHFWAKSEIPYDRFNALFDYYQSTTISNDGRKFSVIIEHDGLTGDGTPINPMVVEIKDNN